MTFGGHSIYSDEKSHPEVALVYGAAGGEKAGVGAEKEEDEAWEAISPAAVRAVCEFSRKTTSVCESSLKTAGKRRASVIKKIAKPKARKIPIAMK